SEYDATGFTNSRCGRLIFSRGSEIRSRGADWQRITLSSNDVFDSDRHAVERTQGLALAPTLLRCSCLGERAFSVDDVHRVEFGLPGLDACQHGARHLERRKLFYVVGIAQFESSEVVNRGCHIVVCGYRSTPECSQSLRTR